MKTLVLVAGHAIPYRFDLLDRDEGWYLKPFQSGEGPLYLDHIKRGVAIAAQKTDSLLVFAGGQTDAAAGPRSEGQGYWLAAQHHGWFGNPVVRERAEKALYREWYAECHCNSGDQQLGSALSNSPLPTTLLTSICFECRGGTAGGAGSLPSF